MLSYIHAYHAGNFADILKHTVFSYTLEHLGKKDKPYTVIDAHSAAGRYNLTDQRILKTHEAEKGIVELFKTDEKVLKEIFGDFFYTILKNYLNKKIYPGSPEISRCYLRKCDTLLLNELHPKVIEELKENIRKPLLVEKTEEPNIYIKNEDASKFLKECIPPKIKRGCVIIDPSYEDKNEYEDTAKMVINSLRKWSTPTYLIWYPLLVHREDEIESMKKIIYDFVDVRKPGDEEKCYFFEIKIKAPSQMTGLAKMYGSGMIVINPPYGLKEKMNQTIPLIEKVLCTNKPHIL